MPELNHPVVRLEILSRDFECAKPEIAERIDAPFAIRHVRAHKRPLRATPMHIDTNACSAGARTLLLSRLPTSEPVDIEIAWPDAGQCRIVRQLGVRLDGRKILEIQVP